MIHHAYVQAVLGNMRLATCPLCRHDPKRYTIHALYDHALDHTLRDVHRWLHHHGATFRLDRHPTHASGMHEWVCRCSAVGRMHPTEQAARDHHWATHTCDACYGCKIDQAVRAL